MENNLQYFIPIVGNLIRYFLFAGAAFLIFYKLFPDRFLKNRIQSKYAQHKDFIREILHSVQSSVIIGAVISLFFFTPLRAYTQIYESVADYATWWIPLSVVLALVVHDTYFYWLHRTMHHPKFYKTIHLMHHKSVNPSPWASYSFHLFEAFTEAMIVPVIIFLLPMHPIALLAFGFASFTINVYGHLGFEIAPKWFRKSFLFEIMNTSVHHNLHHEKFNGNYGLYFRVWDRLMGTEQANYVEMYDRVQERRFGANSRILTAGAKKTTLAAAIILSVGLFASLAAQPTIIGEWHDQNDGGLINIYEENGKYYGELISADNPIENERLEQAKLTRNKIIVLKDFVQESETEFCCGMFFQPKERRQLDGELTLLDANTLRVKGYLGILSGSRLWTRKE